MFKRFIPIILLTAACWVVFLFNNLILGGHFDLYGIRPRQIGSLPGMVFAPFLHASCAHLTQVSARTVLPASQKAAGVRSNAHRCSVPTGGGRTTRRAFRRLRQG